ncbi:MAG: TatD family hydrolase, partial [Bacteroidales bacterium]|nr:TatD family hydrolase [Bacteroidales bacterium]
MIDSHSHIYLEEFDADRTDVVARARQAGVRRLVLPNVDLDTVEPMMALHRAYPTYTSVAMGLHPTSVGENYRADLAAIKEIFDRGGFVAVGEVGIDLYWDKTYRDEQIEVFDEQLRWAEHADLPVIIHCRDGLDEILWTFDNYGGTLPGCVFHSFGGTVADVEAIRRRGDFLFGINGIVTFKNSKLGDVLPAIGLDRILLETDCPYLTPVPHRGRRNESAYIPHVAAKIAELLGTTIDEVSARTDANAQRF